MFEKLEIFRMAQGLATHSAARQSVLAENIANADTPGYRARDLKPFEDSYTAASARDLRVTRAGHVLAGDGPGANVAASRVDRPGALSPNDNNVSLERELMDAAMTKGKHDRALAIYNSALTVLRTAANGGR